MSERRIYADYDEAGIFVYQAFHRGIADVALQHGTFVADAGVNSFSLTRMTWIKPSFAWMLYRAGYGTKPNQEAILRIKIQHAGFLTILSHSVEASYHSSTYSDMAAWQAALKQSPVRHQWDPERTLTLAQHPTRRAIQIGISAWVVQKYVAEWIIGLEDVTPLAHAIQHAVHNRLPLPTMPDERLYPVDQALTQRLAIHI
jgi:hypothetical protein